MFNELTNETADGEQPQNQWLFFVIGAVLISLAELLMLKSLPAASVSIDRLFELVSGLVTGCATGLLVTRLATKTIDVPRGIIVVLMLYAVIQPIFPAIPPNSQPGSPEYGLSVVLMVFALYAKLFFVGAIHWLKDTNRLLYYMIRTLDLGRTENMKRAAFVCETTTQEASHPPVSPAVLAARS